MKKRILLIAFVLLIGKSFSQTAGYTVPNYETIKKDIEDKTSHFYYPKLMERLRANDTLLTKEEFHHLYFGYALQREYDASWVSHDQEHLEEFYSADTIDPKDYDEIIQRAKHSISEFPFDLRQMNLLAYVYQQKGDEVLAQQTNFIFKGVLEAIFFSGDGLQCETAIHVLMVSHEDMLIGFLKLESFSESRKGHCDYHVIKKGKQRLPGLYFNVQKILENEAESPFGR
jgi:hypothetical protein